VGRVGEGGNAKVKCGGIEGWEEGELEGTREVREAGRVREGGCSSHIFVFSALLFGVISFENRIS
jgi:hypothetical protein